MEEGQVVADGPGTHNGEMALGRNLLVAFMPWEGHNYEDAIILNQRLVEEDILTSIHIEQHEIDARDTKLGAEEITRESRTCPRTCSRTWTSGVLCASVPTCATAISWWAR